MQEHLKLKEQIEKQRRLSLINKRTQNFDVEKVEKAIIKVKAAGIMEKIFAKR